MRNILAYSPSPFCSWRVDMSWFCSVCEKSFSRKDNMQRHVISKHRNAGLTPFQTVPMFSQKCQRSRFEHPFTSMIARMTGSGKRPGFDLYCNKLQRPFTLPRRGLVLFTMAACVYTNVSRHATHWILQGNSYGFGACSIPILMWTNGIWSCLMIRWLTPVQTSELRTFLLVVLIIAIWAWFISCRIYFIRGKVEPKQPLSGVIQESTRQTANLDSGEADVSRADGFLFKSVQRRCKKTFWLSSDWSENYYPR